MPSRYSIVSQTKLNCPADKSKASSREKQTIAHLYFYKLMNFLPYSNRETFFQDTTMQY